MGLVETLQTLIPPVIPLNMFVLPAAVVLGMGLLWALPAYFFGCRWH